MVDKILNMDSLEKFSEVSLELTNKTAMAELYTDVANFSTALLSDDLWSNEFLTEITSKPANIAEILKQTQGEHPTVRLVHRLQLLGFCNPGIKRYIQSYLVGACV